MLMTADTTAATADADAVTADNYSPLYLFDEGDSRPDRADKLNANFAIIVARLFNS